MVKKHLAKFLIGAGCILLALAFWLDYDTKMQQQRLIADYELMVANLEEQASDVADDAIDWPDYGDQQDVIGVMSIPKIDLIVAVRKGVAQRTLDFALGHFPESALPGERGNFSVLGHRNYARGQFFNRLGEVEPGDEIIVMRNSREHVYRVTESFVVTPDQISVLDATADAQITLVTCAPARRATHRLIVKGLLVEGPEQDIIE